MILKDAHAVASWDTLPIFISVTFVSQPDASQQVCPEVRPGFNRIYRTHKKHGDFIQNNLRTRIEHSKMIFVDP